MSLGEPSDAGLLQAVAGFLEHTALPRLEGHAQFHGRVALNVLAMLERSQTLGPAATAAEHARLAQLMGDPSGDVTALRTRLCAALRAGQMTEADPHLLNHLLRTAVDRVAIEQPNYASLALARGRIAGEN
jgi:hypothetical protein